MQRSFVSYPKSGRSWVRYMLTLLDAEHAIAFGHDGFEFNDGSRPPHNFDVELRRRAYANVGRVVYLSRDPRDVLVSLYHQVTGRFQDFFGYTESISEFIRDDYFGAEPLKHFRAMWQELSELPNVTCLTYEALHADAFGEMCRILDFLQVLASPEAIRRAVDGAGLEEMRRVELDDNFPGPWLRVRNGAAKVREGKVGAFVEALSPSDVQFLNRVFIEEVGGA